MQNQRKFFYKLSISLTLFIPLISFGAVNKATIVGGKEALPYTYPFMVSIQYKNLKRHFCGGTLISPNTVITAAHCTSDESAEDLRVVISEHDLSVEEGIEQIINVDKIINHKKYNAFTYENDIAILQLSEPVNLGAAAQLITLPEVNEEFTGTTTIIGWGALKSGGKSPDKLNEVEVDIISYDKCNASYDGKILSGMICATAPGKDTCQGDSGGPLFQNNKFVGITSWGYGCARPKYPGVYTEVSKYMDFISVNTIW